jgi:hypothetical protein
MSMPSRTRNVEPPVNYCRALGVHLDRVGYDFLSHTGYVFLSRVNQVPTESAARRFFSYLDPLLARIFTVHETGIRILWTDPQLNKQKRSHADGKANARTLLARSDARVSTKHRAARGDAGVASRRHSRRTTKTGG